MVSIILPVYNSEKYIKETIESIIEQTYTNWELIIVDDNSTDSSMKIVQELKNEKFVIIQNHKNIGPALSRNKALKIAKGRYIAFIDSDDIWNVDKLQKQVEFMQKNDAVFTFTSYERINEENSKVIRKVEVPEKIDYKQLLRNTIILNSTVMIDTKKVDKNLLNMPDYRTGEDIATWIKILQTGVVAYGINEVLIKYRIRKKSLSSNKFKNIIQLYKTYKGCDDLNFFARIKNLIGYSINGIRKRVPNKAFKRIKEIFYLIELHEILDMILFPIIFIISKITGIFIKNKNIWIIQENPNEACDNGYILFKYIRTQRKEINCYYVINKKSKDYNKVKKYGNIINYRSLKHWIYYLNASKILVTQKYANPCPSLFYILHTKNILKTPRIFLQHGIIKDDAESFYYSRTGFRIFICGAKKEYEYVKNTFKYPEGHVIYTGLARYDNLNINENVKNNTILIAPTWRKWIRNSNDKYFQKYNSLVNNSKLIENLKKNNVRIIFVLHKNMKKFKNLIQSNSKFVQIKNNEEVDIQEVLNKADLLVTDFSSIAMDIAYRKRPTIYYQFDEEKFRKEHLKEGYFSYRNDGFGDVIKKEEELVDKINYYIENKFELEEKYLLRIDEFFERRDKNNSKRIVECAINIK